MKFDTLEFIENYNLFYSITGDSYGAVGMYISTIIFIGLIAYLINGLTVGRLPKFKGKKRLMKLTFILFSALFSELFYSFLEYFKTPLAWINQHIWLLFCCFIGATILFIIITFIVIIAKDKMENKAQEIKENNEE